MLRHIIRVALGLAGVLAIAMPARAQVHIQFDGGYTRAAETKTFYAGELGVRLGFFEIDGEVGHLNDVLPTGIRDQLNQLLQMRALPVQGHASLPATYVLGSVRLIAPSGPVRPFIMVGYGMARVQPQLDVAIEGLPVSDVFGIAVAKTENDAMLAAGAGLRVSVAPRVHVDVAYRYLRIFSDFRADTDFRNDKVLTSANSVYAGLGIRF